MTKYFQTIEDPRQQAKGMPSFAETIMIAVCAVIAGCDVREDAEDYCRVNRVGLCVSRVPVVSSCSPHPVLYCKWIYAEAVPEASGRCGHPADKI